MKKNILYTNIEKMLFCCFCFCNLLILFVLIKTAFFILVFFWCFWCFILQLKILLLYSQYKSVKENIKRVTVWKVV